MSRIPQRPPIKINSNSENAEQVDSDTAAETDAGDETEAQPEAPRTQRRLMGVMRRRHSRKRPADAAEAADGNEADAQPEPSTDATEAETEKADALIEFIIMSRPAGDAEFDWTPASREWFREML